MRHWAFIVEKRLARYDERRMRKIGRFRAMRTAGICKKKEVSLCLFTPS